jgi:hypothetical protein
MRWRARRQAFRALLNGDTCIHPASVFDPLSARIAEYLGFQVGLLAGSTASLTVLGAPCLKQRTSGHNPSRPTLFPHFTSSALANTIVLDSDQKAKESKGLTGNFGDSSWARKAII